MEGGADLPITPVRVKSQGLLVPHPKKEEERTIDFSFFYNFPNIQALNGILLITTHPSWCSSFLYTNKSNINIMMRKL